MKMGPGGFKSILCISMLFFIFFGTVGGGSLKSSREEVELAGKLYLMGNEPFTEIGLKLDDGQVYVLRGEYDRELRKLQGKRLSVAGKLLEEKVRGTKAVEVKSFKVLE